MVESKLRAARGRVSWTQEQLATKSGLDVRTIRRIELGKAAPSPDSRLRIAEALNVPLETVFPSTPDGSVELALCEAYATALLKSLRSRTEPFVAPSTIKGEDLVGELLRFGAEGRRACVIGPTGSGKSYALLRVTCTLAEQSYVPIFARCRLMTSTPQGWLDRAVSSYGVESFDALVRAARQATRTLVVIADGLNECPADSFDVTVEALQAVVLAERAGLLVSAQVLEQPWTNAFGIVPVYVAPPSSQDKIELAVQLGANFDGVGPEILAVMKTAMDVTLAAKAWSKVDACTTRFALLHEFNRQRLARAEQPQLCHRAARALADAMTRRATRAISEAEASRTAERHAYPQALPGLVRLGICQLEQGWVSFSHDLHGDYFATQHLLFEHATATALAASLDAPVYASLADLALQAQSDSGSIVALVRQSMSAEGLLAEVLAGALGRLAQEAALQEASALVRHAITDIHNSSIDPRERKANWTTREQSWFKALGAACYEAAPRAIALELLSAADSWVTQHAHSTRLFNEAFDALCHFSSNTPASNLLLHAHNTAYGLWPVRGVALPNELPTIIKAPCTTTLWCLLAKLHVRSHWHSGTFSEGLQDEAIRLIEFVLASGSRSLIMEGLELADDLANAFTPDRRMRILQVLGNIDASDPFVSTFLLDALDAYGVLEPAYDEGVLRSDIAELLAAPEDATAQQKAYGMFGAQLEPISLVHSPHIATISALADGDKAVFYAMAALGAERSDATSDVAICLRDLAKNPAAKNIRIAAVAITTWSRRRPTLAVMPQHDVCNFLEAQRCIVELGVPEPQWPASEELADVVWFELGIIVRGSFSRSRLPAAESAWDRLSGPLVHIAVAPVTWVLNVERMRNIPALLNYWRGELLAFLRRALEVTSVVEWTDVAPSGRTLCGIVIDALGDLGDEADRERLRWFFDDPIVGRTAVAAAKRLAERKANN